MVAAVLGGVACLGLGALAATALAGDRSGDFPPLARFEIAVPGLALHPLRIAALSADGRQIVYFGVGTASGRAGLISRTLDRLEVEPIPIAEAAANPVISRDGGELVFSRGGLTYRVSVEGG